MPDIEQVAKQYCINMADILEETMKRFNYSEYGPLWEIFINDTRTGNYFLYFNFRLVNDEISIQPRTNVGKSIFDYMDKIQGMRFKGH